MIYRDEHEAAIARAEAAERRSADLEDQVRDLTAKVAALAGVEPMPAKLAPLPQRPDGVFAHSHAGSLTLSVEEHGMPRGREIALAGVAAIALGLAGVMLAWRLSYHALGLSVVLLTGWWLFSVLFRPRGSTWISVNRDETTGAVSFLVVARSRRIPHGLDNMTLSAAKEEVRQFYVTREGNGWDLCFVCKNGERSTILHGLRRREDAIYLERTIEHYLSIEDRHVAGEATDNDRERPEWYQF